MFNPTRDQVRQFFFDTWRKYQSAQPLEGAENVAIQVMLEHPEYAAFLEDSEENRARDFPPEFGLPNPYLHLSLHLAIEEQLSINQPTGIRDQFERLAAKLGAAHDAKHVLLDCLAETVWSAQRFGGSVDPQQYSELIEKHLKG